MDEQQLRAHKLALEGKSICIFGEAGCGKSFTINKILEDLRAKYPKQDDVVRITAPTQLAAAAHNSDNIYKIVAYILQYDPASGKIAPSRDWRVLRGLINGHRNKWSATKALFIDEISMLNVWMLEELDALFKEVFQNDLPYGGLQVVFSGDFKQLPPISVYPRGHAKELDDCYAFMSPVWTKLFPAAERICFLETPHRQDADLEFLGVLRMVRNNDLDEFGLNYLKARVVASPPENVICLCPHVATMDGLNADYIRRLPGAAISFNGSMSLEIDSWDGATTTVPITFEDPRNFFKNPRELRDTFRVPYTFELKVGCRVLIAANQLDPVVVNGRQGTLESVSDDRKQLGVRLDVDGEVHFVHEQAWYKEVKDASRRQTKRVYYKNMPVMVGKAITGHACQGMTLESGHVLSGSFTFHQAYAMMSRVSKGEGLTLAAFRPSDIKTSATVDAFLSEIMAAQKKLGLAFTSAAPGRAHAHAPAPAPAPVVAVIDLPNEEDEDVHESKAARLV